MDITRCTAGAACAFGGARVREATSARSTGRICSGSRAVMSACADCERCLIAVKGVGCRVRAAAHLGLYPTSGSEPDLNDSQPWREMPRKLFGAGAYAGSALRFCLAMKSESSGLSANTACGERGSRSSLAIHVFHPISCERSDACTFASFHSLGGHDDMVGRGAASSTASPRRAQVCGGPEVGALRAELCC